MPPFSEILELFGTARCEQRVDELVQIAVHHGVELIKRQTDAVIGHAPLREVIRAYALRAVAGADLGAALIGILRVALLAHHLVQAAAQYAHGLFAVLYLAALVLRRDDQAGGQVRYAHGGVGTVNMLTARARRAVRIYAQIVLVDLKIDVLDLGQHGHGRG